jgi:membrane-anchored protein YejM (alkaline phosphatase superfamily)
VALLSAFDVLAILSALGVLMLLAVRVRIRTHTLLLLVVIGLLLVALLSLGKVTVTLFVTVVVLLLVVGFVFRQWFVARVFGGKEQEVVNRLCRDVRGICQWLSR